MSVQVVVVGAGYAGLMAANRVAAARRPEKVTVTLITEEASFVERIRLHEYACGSTDDATVPFDSLLHPAVQLRVTRVLRVEAASRELALLGGTRLAYDYLIYAAGSGGHAPDGEGIHVIADLQGATRARAALDDLPAGSAVAVVGGGPTAVEVAAELAERRPVLTVKLHTSGVVAPSVSVRSRSRLRRALARRKVQLVEGEAVAADGDVRAALDAEVVLWCTGFTAPGLAADSGLPVTSTGQLRVGPTLAAVSGGDRIYGAGDAASIENPLYRYHRMGCASALPMGAHAADNVLRLIGGEAPKPLSTGFVAQCISIGRREGLIQAVTPEDRPRRLALSGRLGALVKEAVCRQTLRWLRGEARSGGSYSWPKGPTPVGRVTKEAV
jgi:NADH dehydrogenase